MNNIYVKNFPTTWDEAKLRQVFGQYGNILSLLRIENDKGENGQKAAFAFICYGSEDEEDTAYGPECALKAIAELHGQTVEDHTLYVKAALKKGERELEKKKDMMRFKNSKKRCNLHVKNFKPETTKQQLEELFGQHGEIESVKLMPKEGEA